MVIGFLVCFLVLSLIGIAMWYVRMKKKKVAEFGGGYAIPAPMGSFQISGSFFSIVLNLPIACHSRMGLSAVVIRFQLGIISIV